MKDTSVTGYLRQITNPNLRQQDIVKQPLLCSNCEALFSTYEDQFARNIFYPYVQKELDEWGVAQGEIRSINYGEWLLKFAVSLQWRALTTSTKINSSQQGNERMRNRFNDLFDAALFNWGEYLLGKSDISG